MPYTTTAILKIEADNGIDKYTFSSTPILPRINVVGSTITMKRDEIKVLKCIDTDITGKGQLDLVAIKSKYPFDVAFLYSSDNPNNPLMDVDYKWSGVYSYCYYRTFSEGTVAYPTKVEFIAIKLTPDSNIVPITIEEVELTVLNLHGD